MGRRKRKGLRANPENASPAYWNKLLKRAGLGVDAGKLPKGRGPVGKKMVRVSAGAHASARTVARQSYPRGGVNPRAR